MNFAVEPFEDVLPQLRKLAVEHYHEVVRDKELFEFNPNWEVYINLARAGALLTFTARNEDKRLCGYILMLTIPSPHYRHVKVAKDSAHYLHPSARKGLAALAFFRFVEEELKKRDFRAVIFHTKEGRANRGSVFERMGYSLHEEVFLKKLGE